MPGHTDRRILAGGVGLLDVALNGVIAAIGLCILVGGVGGPYWLAFTYARQDHLAEAVLFALVWTGAIATFVRQIRRAQDNRPPWVWGFIATGLAFTLAGHALT